MNISIFALCQLCQGRPVGTQDSIFNCKQKDENIPSKSIYLDGGGGCKCMYVHIQKLTYTEYTYVYALNIIYI